MTAVAVVTVGPILFVLVIVAALVERFIVADDGTAMFAYGVVAGVAALTQGRVHVSGVGSGPDSSITVATDNCDLGKASGTVEVSFKFAALGQRMLLATVFTDKGFRHGDLLPKIEISPRGLPLELPNYNMYLKK